MAAGDCLIIGLGVDIAEVGRIRGGDRAAWGDVFAAGVYGGGAEYCERFKNKYERFAGRFAAKEAAMKALGTGWSRGVRWVDVEVVRQKRRAADGEVAWRGRQNRRHASG